MTRDETLKIMAVLKATYPNFYKDMTRRDAEGVVALWTDMFAEERYNAVAAAVKAFIASDSKGFPPVVGQVKQRVTELASAKALPGTQRINTASVSEVGNGGLYGKYMWFSCLCRW